MLCINHVTSETHILIVCSMGTGLCSPNKKSEKIVFHPVPINTEEIYGAFLASYTVLLSIFLKGENSHSDEMSVSILVSSSIHCIHGMARELSHRLASGSAPQTGFSSILIDVRCQVR